MGGWWRLVARYRRARRRRIERERRIGARLAVWGTRQPRPAPLDLRRAWRMASAEDRVRFLAEIEELPY